MILLTVKTPLNKIENKATSSSDDSIEKENVNKDIQKKEVEDAELTETESLYYKIGDAVDCIDQTYGAWSEAIIQKIFKQDTELIYNVKWEFDDQVPSFNIFETFIRPRARYLVPFNKLSVGQKVMVNYNVDDPKEIGLWYDFTITKLEKKEKLKELIGVVHIGR